VSEASVVPLDLDDTWAYGPGIQHGGFLLETVTRQALTAAHPDPLAVTSHFLSAPRIGAAAVHVTPLRTGRSVATARAQLVQGDRVCLDVVVTAGVLGAPGAPAYVDTAPPALPPVEDCPRNAAHDGRRNGITEQLDLRLDPSAAGWMSEPSDRAEVRGWVRFADGRPVDTPALLCLADALPPVTFALGLTGWVPTVSLSVHVRAVPAPGWLRLVQRARLLADGWLDEECEVWDSTDRLVAQGHQLAGYRP
jgi:Thioesterase-like superfamily